MFELPRRYLLGSLAAAAFGHGTARAEHADSEKRRSPSTTEAATPVSSIPSGSPYDVRQFGAVWDGGSHPLSERFATLADARKIYPFAGSLSDEIDWAATQLAINQGVLDWVGAGSRHGTTVQLPSGVGRFNRTIFFPANLHWLSDNAAVVNLQGHGRGSTILEWRDNDADIDDGYVLQPRNPEVEDDKVHWVGNHALLHADCRLSGFALRGPGTWHDFLAPTTSHDFETRYGFLPDRWETAFNSQNARIGQLHEKFGGLSAGECTCLSDLFIEGFHVGINWRGGQKLASYIYVRDCYYGLYVTFTPEAHGDFLLSKCNLSGRFAAIALAPDAGFFGHLDTCYIGNTPYGFYKEGTDVDLTSEEALMRYGGHWNDFISGVLTYCQFESVGNSLLCEGNINRRHQIKDLTLENCAYIDWHDFSFPRSDHGFKGAILNDALIDAARWSRVTIRRSHDPDRWRPRDIALFMFGEAEDVFVDSCDGFLKKSAEFNRSLFFCSGNGVKPPGSIRISGDGWSGCIFYLDPDRVGSVEAEIAPGDLVGRYRRGCRAFTAGALDLLGVALERARPLEGTACIAVADVTDVPMTLNPTEPPNPEAQWWEPSLSSPGKIVLGDENTGLNVYSNDLSSVSVYFNKILASIRWRSQN